MRRSSFNARENHGCLAVAKSTSFPLADDCTILRFGAVPTIKHSLSFLSYLTTLLQLKVLGLYSEEWDGKKIINSKLEMAPLFTCEVRIKPRKTLIGIAVAIESSQELFWSKLCFISTHLRWMSRCSVLYWVRSASTSKLNKFSLGSKIHFNMPTGNTWNNNSYLGKRAFFKISQNTF